MKQVKLNTLINKSYNEAVDLNLLVVFELLLREHSVTRTAEHLGVSQAAVSASLKRLRAMYDDPLFVRTQKGIMPTVHAVLLQPMVEDALALVRQSLNMPDSQVNDTTQLRIVTIGLSDDFEMAYGATLIHVAQQNLPNIRIVFRQTNSIIAVDALHERSIDLAITSGGTADTRIKRLSLGNSGYLCIYDSQRRTSKDALTIEEYIAREHLLISYSGLVGVVDDVLAEQGLRRRIRAATTHFAGLPFLLLGTDAIATLPSHAARAVLRMTGFSSSPCPIAFPHYPIELSWRFDSIRKPSILMVRDMIAQTLAQVNP